MNKRISIIAALFVGLVGAWIYAEKKNATAVQPPVAGTKLVIFLEKGPQVNQIRRFVHTGKVHVEVIGKAQVSAFSLPSGSPAYIFDETGALVDWCRDLGDNPSFVKRWGGFTNASSISVEEAKQIVKGNAP